MKAGTQTCWFTAARIGDERNTDGAYSRVHLIPLHSATYNALSNVAKHQNAVPTFLFVKRLVEGLNISTKYAIRDRLMLELYGTTKQNHVPEHDRGVWSPELGQHIARVVAEEATRQLEWQKVRNDISTRIKQKFGHRFKITDDLRHAIFRDLGPNPAKVVE